MENLMMAGCNASATHVAYASTKLMKTGGQMGRAVGAATMLCHKYRATPRGVYQRHLEELRDVVFQKGKYRDCLKPRPPQAGGSDAARPCCGLSS